MKDFEMDIARHYDESLTWLNNAGLVCPVHRIKTMESLLRAIKKQGFFKNIYLKCRIAGIAVS